MRDYLVGARFIWERKHSRPQSVVVTGIDPVDLFVKVRLDNGREIKVEPSELKPEGSEV